MVTDEISIRWYFRDDYDSVAALVRELASIFNDPFDERWFRLYMEKRLMDPIPGVYVAVNAAGDVVGSAFCDILRDPTGSQYGYISNIMVRSDFRGSGIGEKLLKIATQYLTVAGVPRIWANVREETESMVHLFEKAGFSKKFSTFEYHPSSMDE